MKIKKLSQMEWTLMEVLWNESPLSASEIQERAQKHVECNVKTVRSLLDRMMKKKTVARKKIHGIWVFDPAIEKDECLLQESRSFLDRFFGGDPAPLLAHLVQNDVLSDEDIKRLENLIQSNKRKGE